jgi:hypothetical protein
MWENEAPTNPLHRTSSEVKKLKNPLRASSSDMNKSTSEWLVEVIKPFDC